jgi:hypothetical protein
MRKHILHDNRSKTIAWEVVNKKINQREVWLYSMAVDYFYMAPSVVLFGEENFVFQSVTRTSEERCDLCTVIHLLSVSERESETRRVRYLVQNTG